MSSMCNNGTMRSIPSLDRANSCILNYASKQFWRCQWQNTPRSSARQRLIIFTIGENEEGILRGIVGSSIDIALTSFFVEIIGHLFDTCDFISVMRKMRKDVYLSPDSFWIIRNLTMQWQKYFTSNLHCHFWEFFNAIHCFQLI